MFKKKKQQQPGSYFNSYDSIFNWLMFKKKYLESSLILTSLVELQKQMLPINGITLFWGAPKSLQMLIAAMKLKDAYSLEGKLWPTQHIKKQRHYFVNKNQGYGLSSSHGYGL